MSLAKRIKTSIDTDLLALETELKTQLSSKKRELEMQISKLERIYKTDVESEIQHQVNARIHKESKEHRFSEGFSFQDQLSRLFIENLEEILATKLVSKLTDAFFSAIKNADNIIIGGQHRSVLMGIAQSHALKFDIQDSPKLGYVLANYPDQTLEFDLQDLIFTLQKKYLSAIIA